MTDEQSGATILVVDDEQSVADGYALRLGSQYDDVETAYGGPETLEVLEATDVDVLLLDRRMPEMTGDEVLDEVRERGYDCRVIMVTAVNPDFDIVDMPFDDYLQKPIEKENLFAAIEQQLHAEQFDSDLEQYFAASSKIAVLEADKSEAQLADNKKYRRLKEEAARLESDLEEQVEQFDDAVNTFSSIDRT
jgi:CheY-like chemotaxis protein